MHFFRDYRVTDFCSCKIDIPYILYISSVLESACTLRFSAIASCITLPPASMLSSARWLLGLRPRPAGQPLAVVSATLQLLALIAIDGMYVCLFRLRAPTVGAGAKKQIIKKSLFLEAPHSYQGYHCYHSVGMN